MRLSTALTGLAALAAAALALAPAATARPAADVRSVDWANVTVPGSTCFSAAPIRLHDGTGDAGYRDGHRVVVQEFGHPTYGAIDSRGDQAAFVSLSCEYAGGTAASELLESVAVFSPGAVPLGVITPHNGFPGRHVSLLQVHAVHDGTVTIRESVYAPGDPDCCAGIPAESIWTVGSGGVSFVRTTLGLDPGTGRFSDRYVRDRWVGGVMLQWYHGSITAAYPDAIHTRHGNGCSEYSRFRSPNLGFHAFLGPLSQGHVYGITAPDGAMTLRGVGDGSTYSEVKHAYADRPGYVSGHWYYAYLGVHDYVGFHIAVTSYSKTVDAVRIGWRFFAAGGPLCG